MNGTVTNAAPRMKVAVFWERILGAGGIILLLGAAISLVTAPEQGWAALLVGGIYSIHVVLGGALFLALAVLTGAKWWNPIRPVAKALADSLLIPAIVIGVVLVLGARVLYPWAHAGAAEASHLVEIKSAWLNLPLFLARAGIVLLVWFFLTRSLGRRLAAVIAEPTPEARKRLARLATGFMVLFAVTISVAWWDWIMSLEPEWFSTMFGVYGFAGTFQAGIAATIVLAVLFSRRGWLGVQITEDILHDLGKLLFAFSMFWGYIWICQYMLIWYANIPEEITHFLARSEAGWSTPFWLVVLLNFGIPFVVLLPERTKRHRLLLVQVALIVLAGRWLDTYLLIAPAVGEAPLIPTYAIAATLGVLALMAALFLRRQAAD